MKKWVLPPGITSFIGHLLAPSTGLINEPHESDPHKRQITSGEQALLAHNEALKDRHKGKRCFILGAGPSVKKQNLQKLAGEIVISVSNTFVHQDFPMFRPQYHVLPPLLRSHGELYAEEKFIVWLKEMEERTFDAEMFFHIGDRDMIEKTNIYSDRNIHWVEYSPWDETSAPVIDLSKVPEIWSVSELALTIAVYMGFEKIYLLGIDHDWFNGLYAYFYDEKTEHKLRPDQSRIAFVDSEYQMRRHAFIFRKYKYLYGLRKNIFNANADPNTYVDVFPKIRYDDLFPSGK